MKVAKFIMINKYTPLENKITKSQAKEIVKLMIDNSKGNMYFVDDDTFYAVYDYDVLKKYANE